MEVEVTRRRRKSDRPRKRAKAYSPEPQPAEDVKKKKKIGKTQPNRPYDILPNGEAFSCTLCQSGYVGNVKGSKKAVKSRHTPLPKVRIDQHTGRELQLCNACAQSFDRPRHRVKKPEVTPTEEEQEEYLNEAKIFTTALRANIDVPYVDKLFCPVSKKKLCGCLQRYIKNEMMISGNACVQDFVELMTEAEALRKEKVYSPTEKTKPKRSVGLGNGHKKSKRYEEFVITHRRDLKEDMRLCERATQRILMYSNNFLHKKLKTEERPCRIERTRGKAALGKLPEIHLLVDMVCCAENCVMMALTHRKLLQSWRERSKLGQTERRRVLAEMLTPAGASHRNCYHFIGYVTGCSPSTIGRVYNMMLENNGNREPPEHGMKKVWQESYKQNKVVGHDGEKSLIDDHEDRPPLVSESVTSQKQTKPTHQTLLQASTDPNGQMQYEFQKQQLAQIQMDLLQKQQQLEQQQANLQMQLMAQQALVQQPDSTHTNQIILQQILQQISQQQYQNTLDHGKPGTSQSETHGNQSALTGSSTQTVSVPKQPSLPLLNVNYVNGEIQLSFSGLNQSADQVEDMTPKTLTLDDSLDGHEQRSSHVSLEGNISNTNQVILDQHNALNIYRNQSTSQPIELPGLTRHIQLPDSGLAVPNTASFVNTSNVNIDMGPPMNNLQHNELNEMENQESPMCDEMGTRMQLVTNDQSKQTSNAFVEPPTVCNVLEQGTISTEQTDLNTPRYLIQLVPGPGDITNTETSQPMINQNLQGQLRLNGIPLQLMDSSGQQYHIITGGVQNQNEGVIVSQDQISSQVPVVNLTIPMVSHSNHQEVSSGVTHIQEALYNTVGTNIDGRKALTQSTEETHVIDGNQFNIQPGSNIHLSMNAGNQGPILNVHKHNENVNQQTQIQVSFNTERKESDTDPHQFYTQDSILTVPLYETTDFSTGHLPSDGNIPNNGKITNHPLEKNQHPKRNVQFKNIQEMPSQQDCHLIVKDVVSLQDCHLTVKDVVSQEDNVVNPDLVLPRPHASRSRHTSGNSVRSRQSSGNAIPSRHSSGNSVSNIDSFRQLTSSFKLKDLAKTGSTFTANRKSSGDRSRQSSGDRSRHPSGDRSRQPSGDRSRQPSGDRSRQPSGDRSRQPSGNSMFSEYSNLSTISPNLFLNNKDKNLFFLQSIDSMSGAFDDVQSPDYAMFNSSPTNTGTTSLPEIALTEAGRIDFDSHFIASSLLSHDSSHCETDGIKEQSHYDSVVSLNQVPPAVAMSTTESSGQKALRNPVLNSILSRPPKHLTD